MCNVHWPWVYQTMQVKQVARRNQISEEGKQVIFAQKNIICPKKGISAPKKAISALKSNVCQKSSICPND